MHATIHDVAANEVFDAIPHHLPVVRVEPKRWLRKYKSKARSWLHAKRDSPPEPSAAVKKGVVQVHVDGVEAAQSVGGGEAGVEMLAKLITRVIL